MLGLALQIGFLRMSGRLLDAVPMVLLLCGDTSERSLQLPRRTWRRFAPCIGVHRPSSSISR